MASRLPGPQEGPLRSSPFGEKPHSFVFSGRRTRNMGNKSQKYPCEVSMTSCLLLRAWKGHWATGGVRIEGVCWLPKSQRPPEPDCPTCAHPRPAPTLFTFSGKPSWLPRLPQVPWRAGSHRHPRGLSASPRAGWPGSARVSPPGAFMKSLEGQNRFQLFW